MVVNTAVNMVVDEVFIKVTTTVINTAVGINSVNKAVISSFINPVVGKIHHFKLEVDSLVFKTPHRWSYCQYRN
jgi:hypothetical protein